MPTFVGKQRNSRKISASASLTMLKSLCGSQQTGKCLNRWEYLTTLSVPRDTCVPIKKKQIEPDLEQPTWGNIRQGFILPPCLLNFYEEYIM